MRSSFSAKIFLQRFCRPFLLIAAFVAASSLSACGLFGEIWEWNQKLTVEVMTPNGVVSGSAVSRVQWRSADIGGNYHTEFSGEATVVEVAPGRYLFALIGESTKYIAQYTFHQQLGIDRGNYETLLPSIMKLRQTAEVPRNHYPLLVTFADINNPKTVTRVDPNNLAAVFGQGVSLQRVTLGITDENVSNLKVGALLSWLGEYPEPGLCKGNGETQNIPFCSQVHFGDFARQN